MTLATTRVLGCLSDAAGAELYGFEIGREAHLPSGTVYPILHRLERAGWITSYWGPPGHDGTRRRRYYRLTGLGEAKVRELPRVEPEGSKVRWSY
jgi:PadR family transcriptional regulator PadR